MTYSLKRLVCPIDYPWLDRAFGPDTLFYDAPSDHVTNASHGKVLRLSRTTNTTYQIPVAALEEIESCPQSTR